MAGAAQAQATTFTYGELDKSPAAVLARKTLGAHGERFVLLKREEPHGLFRTGERYFTFAQTPTSSFYRGCQTRLAHARYQPLERNGRSEPPQARLKLDDVWFENVFIRLPSAPVYDGSSRFEARMDRFCGKMDNVFDMFSAKDFEAAGRAVDVVDTLTAGPAPSLDCEVDDDCPALVRRILTGRLFHVEQWDCGPLDGMLPTADAIVCQELRFDMAPRGQGHVGALRVRFREGADTKTQARVRTLQAVHAQESLYVE